MRVLPAGGLRWTTRWTAVFGVTAVLLPLVVAGVRLAAQGDYNPSFDRALIELQVRDVGHHPVLLGPFSREGWNHPGPSLFYALAVPYRLAGGAAVALLAGALLVNGAALMGMAVLAWRRGGPELFLLTVLASLLLVRSLGMELLVDPWNPFVTVLPFGLLLLLTLAMTGGETWALPVAVGVGSFLVQSHIGFVAVVTALIVSGVVGLAMDLRRGGGDTSAAARRRSLVRAAAAGAAVLIVLWAPPVFDQVARSGNLGQIFEYFTESKEHRSFSTALKTVALQFDATPEWLVGPAPTTLTSEVPHDAPPGLPVLLVGSVAGTVVAWRRGWRPLAHLGALVLLAAAVAVISVTRIVGPVIFYLVRWTWVIGMAAGIVAVSVLLRLMWARAGPAAKRWSLSGVGAMAAVLGVVLTIEATRVEFPNQRRSAIVESLARQVVPEVANEGRPVLVRSGGSAFPSYQWGLAAALEREGVEVAVEREHRDTFGRHRVIAARRARTELFVAEGDVIDELGDQRAYRPIAHAGDRPAREAARTRARLRDLQARHARGDLSAVEYLERVAALPTGDVDVVVYHRRVGPDDG